MNDEQRFAVRDITWTPEKVRRYWEYETEQTNHSFALKHGRKIVAYVRHLLLPPARILDVGAGPGFLTEALLAEGYEVASLEESSRGRELCASRNGGRPGFLGVVGRDDARRFGTFDAAIAVEVIEHLTDEELVASLDLLVDLVEPGGTCVLTTPNGERLDDNKVACPQCGTRFHRWQHVRSIGTQEMADCLGHPGLEPVVVFATDWSARVPARFRANPLSTRRLPARPHLVGVGRRLAH